MNKKMILFQPWGGLGDNLQFSTLPKICHEHNIDFYLHETNHYRNEEIYDLVWKKNPYVKGFSKETPNAGSVAKDAKQSAQYNIIGWNEIRHGFENRNNYAEIYYDCKKLKKFNQKIVVNLDAVSSIRDNLYDMNVIYDYINNMNNKNIILLMTKFNKYFETLKVKHDIYKIDNIFEYCDIIFSAKKHYSLFSGSSVLAATIKEKYSYDIDLFCFYPHRNFPDVKMKNEKKDWIFENTRYILRDNKIIDFSLA